LVTSETDPIGNYVLLPFDGTNKTRERQGQATATQSIFNWGNI
jgi:hypothetical protein